MTDFERHPGVVVHWQVYGSSGQLADDLETPVIERFVHRAPTSWVRNRRVKSIVQPTRTLDPNGPHVFDYADGPAVDETGTPVVVTQVGNGRRRMRRVLCDLSPRLPLDPYAVAEIEPHRPTVERLRINHYAVKSRSEFASKTARFSAPFEGAPALGHRYDDRYFVYHDRNDVVDPILRGFGVRVRA